MRNLIVAAVLMLAAPALASEHGSAPTPAPTVLMSPMALPVVQGGKLVNYIFVNVRLQLRQSPDAARMRDQEPFFRDAIVRAAYRTSVVQVNDPNKLDDARFRALVLAETNRVAGKGSVTGLTVLRQTPQKILRGAPAPTRVAESGRPQP